MEHNHQTPFCPVCQREALAPRIFIAFERISTALRMHMWRISTEYHISPVQLYILIFLRYHKPEKVRIVRLAKILHVSVPTVSDALHTLRRKGYLIVRRSKRDRRVRKIHLTQKGKDLSEALERWAQPFVDILMKWSEDEQLQLYTLLTKAIEEFYKRDLIHSEGMCIACQNFEPIDDVRYRCALMKKELSRDALQLDCPNYTYPS